MNKKYFLLLFLVIFSIIVIQTNDVEAGKCSPSSGYRTCYENTASPRVKIETTSMWSWTYDGKKYIARDITVKCPGGDRLTLYSSPGKINCGGGGCSGGLNSWNGQGPWTIKIENYAPISPTFVCFDSSGGDWVWQSTYWSNTYYKKANSDMDRILN